MPPIDELTRQAHSPEELRSQQRVELACTTIGEDCFHY